MDAKTAGRDEWLAARKALVDELTQLRNRFSRVGWLERSEAHLIHDRTLPALSRTVPPIVMGFADAQPILR